MADESTADAPAASVMEGDIPDGYKVLKEGKARILMKDNTNDVFYNPAQVFNRDMSLLVLRWFVKQREEENKSRKNKKRPRHNQPAPPKLEPVEGLRILEGLAATGLRALRYSLELEGVGRVDAHDLEADAVAAMHRNISINGERAKSVMVPRQGDVRMHMLQHPQVYDVVDLDPYGSPAQFLDQAVQAVSDGGLLMVTATDMAVLCGNNGESCWSKYGSYPLHRPYCHEQALRILLRAIEAHAIRYKRHIVPVVSLSIDFYIRVFMRVYTSAGSAKLSATKQAYVYQSQGCDSFFLQPVGKIAQRNNNIRYMPGSGPAVPERCPETGAGFLMGGPIWAGGLHDAPALDEMMQILQQHPQDFPSEKKLRSILLLAQEELPDAPLYYCLHDICKTLHCTPPKMETFRSALVNAGYRVSSTHCKDIGVKTDAPAHVIWDILRCWVREHPVRKADAESYVGRLLAKQPQLEANFARANAALSKAKQSKEPRFLPNPQERWGPRSRHGRPQVPMAEQSSQPDTQPQSTDTNGAANPQEPVPSQAAQAEEAGDATPVGAGGENAADAEPAAKKQKT